MMTAKTAGKPTWMRTGWMPRAGTLETVALIAIL
jgi:hypothetical protein